MDMSVQTKLGVTLLCLSVAIDAAVIFTGIPLSLLLSKQALYFIVPIAPLALRVFLIAMIWKGENWARIVFVLLALAGVAALPFLPTATRGYWLLVLSLLFQAAGLALLFLQPAASWFKKVAPAND